jgi:hypothetical protein
MPPANPYAPPRAPLDVSEAPADQRPWRLQGRLLLARKWAKLPDICLYTGAPESEGREERQLSWTPVWFKVLLVIAPLIGLIAYASVRRTGNIEYALGPVARRRRRRASVIALLVAALPGALLAAAGADGTTVLGLVAVLLIVSLVIASSLTRGFGVRGIDNQYVQLWLTLPAAEAFARLERDAAPAQGSSRSTG